MRLLVTVCAASLVLACLTEVSAQQPPALQWGAHVGWQAEKGPKFEAMVGKPMNLRAVFIHWGNENQFPQYLAPVMQGRTLVIFWEAKDYTDDSPHQPKFAYRKILEGKWDAYITAFATAARLYQMPVILIPFSEMNGNWNPSSGTKNGNTPAEHIAAYKYVRKFFALVPNVKFGWAVNNVSVPDVPGNAIDVYYPGTDSVDYVGIDGFNFGNPWQTFDQVFGRALTTLKAYNKPVYIFSMASKEGDKKPAWIADALKLQIAAHPEIKGWIWFHENKERDWRVNSDPKSLQAFKNALP